MDVARPRGRSATAPPGVLSPAFGESSLGEEPTSQNVAYCCGVGMACDEGRQLFDCGIRSLQRERHKSGTDREQLIVRRTGTRLCQHRLGVRVSTVVAIEHCEAVGDIEA